MPRKHCDIFARCSDSIDVPDDNDLETSSKWTGTVQIMKKDSDFRSGWRLCFPDTKLHSMLYIYYLHFKM